MGLLKNSICIINPTSGNKKWERDKIIREGLEFYIDGPKELTKSKEQAIQLAKEAAKKYSIIVAVGGDGTVLDVINGIMESGKSPDLGIIPLGTGNCFVDSLGISKNVKKACINLAKGKPKAIDLTEIVAFGMVNNYPSSEHKYSQVSSIGLDARILHLRDISKEPGFMGYVMPTLKTICSYNPQPKSITLKDGSWFGGKFEKKNITLDNNMQLVVTKGKYYGFKFKIAPKAELDDGYLDITLFNMRKRDLMLNFHKIYFGKHADGIAHFKAKEVFVEGEKLPCQHDGEFLGEYSNIKFKVKEKAIKILVPY